jgi:DNA-binding XRE family transcriptional regulator
MHLLQKDVARLVGVHEQTVSDWETNENVPKVYLIPKIVDFLGHNPFGNTGCLVLEQKFKPAGNRRGLAIHDLHGIQSAD